MRVEVEDRESRNQTRTHNKNLPNHVTSGGQVVVRNLGRKLEVFKPDFENREAY